MQTGRVPVAAKRKGDTLICQRNAHLFDTMQELHYNATPLRLRFNHKAAREKEKPL
jgi:hypothetical protein